MLVIMRDQNGEWQKTSDQQDIQESCVEENHIRSTQAITMSTPLTQQPLLGEFGYLAMGESLQHVLKGTYNPPMEWIPLQPNY